MAKIRTAALPEPSGPAYPDWRRLRGLASTRAALQKSVKGGTLPPVVLLVGRRGLGKTLLAAELAAMFLCDTRDACGACDSCRMTLAGVQPEILHLANDGESIDLETAQSAQEHVSLRPQSGAAARVVLVEDLDRLTVPAANRLLKTLEEPPHGARFVLTSSRPGAILATVRSRAVAWRVAPPPYAELVAIVSELAAERGLTLPEEPGALERIAKLAGGAPGEALRALERGAVHALEGTARDLVEPDRLGLFDAAQSLRGAPASSLLEALEIELNARYHDSLLTGRPVTEARRAKARRTKLRAARRATAHGRVAISAQLVAESFALI